MKTPIEKQKVKYSLDLYFLHPLFILQLFYCHLLERALMVFKFYII